MLLTVLSTICQVHGKAFSHITRVNVHRNSWKERSVLLPFQDEVRRPGAHGPPGIRTQLPSLLSFRLWPFVVLRRPELHKTKAESPVRPLGSAGGRRAPRGLGNWGSWEVTGKLLVTFYRLLGRLRGCAEGPTEAPSPPGAWPALGRGEGRVLPPSAQVLGRRSSESLCIWHLRPWLAGTCRTERCLVREAKPLGPGSCTLQDNASPSLGNTERLFL